MGTFQTRRANFDWRGFITPGVQLIVVVCTSVFLAQSLAEIFIGFNATAWINHFFGLVPLGPVPGLRLWQPITYMFLHGG
jgi:membrane associated rhomboid family serine protease